MPRSLVAARRVALPHRAWAWRVLACGIGSLATFWMIKRLVGFWP